MIDRLHVASYSIAARVCLAIAVFGGALLVATMISSTYFMR
jgi:hypothetical protein